MIEMSILNRKAFSVVEYTVLFVIIMSAFFYLRPYIQRGIFGMWGQSGKGFAFGRQYDAQKSIECNFDAQSGKWYDLNCYEAQSQSCNAGDTACQEAIMSSTCATSTCSAQNQ